MAKTTKTKLSLPPARKLQVSLALVSQGRVDDAVTKLKATSTDQVRRWARQAQALSEKSCFFCETRRTKKQNATPKSWAGYVLCPCLAKHTRGPQVHGGWTKSPRAVTSADIKRLFAGIDKGLFPEELPAYSNDCVKCEERFTLSFKTIRDTIARHGLTRYTAPSLCKKCRGAPRRSHAARPRRSASGKLIAVAA